MNFTCFWTCPAFMNRIMKEFTAVYFWSNKTAEYEPSAHNGHNAIMCRACDEVCCCFKQEVFNLCENSAGWHGYARLGWLQAQHLVTRHPQPLLSHWGQAALQALISCKPFWCLENFGSHPARGAITIWEHDSHFRANVTAWPLSGRQLTKGLSQASPHYQGEGFGVWE